MPCVGVNNILFGFFLLNMFVQQHNNVPVHWFRLLAAKPKSPYPSLLTALSVRHTQPPCACRTGVSAVLAAPTVGILPKVAYPAGRRATRDRAGRRVMPPSASFHVRAFSAAGFGRVGRRTLVPLRYAPLHIAWHIPKLRTSRPLPHLYSGLRRERIILVTVHAQERMRHRQALSGGRP